MMIIHFPDDTFAEINHLEKVWIEKCKFKKAFRLCIRDINYKYLCLYTYPDRQALVDAKNKLIRAYMEGDYGHYFQL